MQRHGQTDSPRPETETTSPSTRTEKCINMSCPFPVVEICYVYIVFILRDISSHSCPCVLSLYVTISDPSFLYKTNAENRTVYYNKLIEEHAHALDDYCGGIGPGAWPRTTDFPGAFSKASTISLVWYTVKLVFSKTLNFLDKANKKRKIHRQNS